MTRRILSVLAFAAFAAIAPLTAAQAPAPAGAPAGAPQGPGGPAGAPGAGRGGAQAAPARLDLTTARKAIEAAEAAAVAANARVAISVVDANGDLVYFRRMDGAAGQAVTSSQGKARVAILFGVPSKAVADAAAAGTPLSATLTASGVGQQALQIQQGGIPIMKDGRLVGGIGAGGSSPQNDEVFAKAGADAVK